MKRISLPALPVAFLLAGCSSSYVDYPQLSQPVNRGPLPAVTAVVNDLEVHRRKAIELPRNDDAELQRWLGYGTLAAIGGGTTAALYGASKDAVLGFGLAGGAAYTTSQLYLSSPRLTLLTNANTNFRCIVNSGSGVVSKANMLLMQMNIVNADYVALKATDASSFNAELKNQINEAIDEYETARGSFASFQALDPQIAARLSKGADETVKTLNEELVKLNPTPERVLQAARGIGAFGSGFLVSAPAAKTDVSKVNISEADKNNAEKQNERMKLAEKQAKAVNDAAKEIKQGVKDALNDIANIESCVLSVPPLAKFAANQAEISVTKDQKITIELSGGLPPYTASWKPPGQPDSSKEADFFIVGNQLLVLGKSNIKAATYALLAKDSKPAPDVIEIKVTTIKPGS